jgi:hypothetical protein
MTPRLARFTLAALAVVAACWCTAHLLIHARIGGGW